MSDIQPTETNPYSDLLASEAQRLQVQQAATAVQVEGTDPDRYATQRRIASYLGYAPAVVEATPEASDAEFKRRQLQDNTAAHPVLQAKYADADFHRLAIDDSGTLGKIAGAFAATAKYVFSAPDSRQTLAGDIAGGYYSASRGAAGTFRAAFDSAAAAAEVFLPGLRAMEQSGTAGGDPLRRVAEGFSLIAENSGARQKAASPPSDNLVMSGVSSGVQSFVGNALMLPLALVPGGEAAALYGMSAQQGGSSYQEAREKGVPIGTALPYALAQGVIEYATEKIPLHALIGNVKAGSSVLTTLARTAAAEVPGEQVATVLQDMNEWAVLPENRTKPFTEYLKERPSAAAQTLIATIIGVGGNVAVMKSAQSAVDRATGTQREVAEAQQDAERLQQLFALAAQSKLRERSPQHLADFIQAQAENTEGAPTEVYVDARTLAGEGGLLNQETLAQLLPSVNMREVADAVQSGGDVALPIGELMANVAGTPLEQRLLEHLRTTPEGLSPFEAKQAQEQAAEYLRSEAARVIGESTQATAAQQSAEAVKAQVLQQLAAANRFTPEVNDAYASLVRDFYTTTSSRLGLTPEEMHARYPLRVAAVNPAAAGLMQPAYHGTPHQVSKFTTSKIGTGEGAQAYGWGMYFAKNRDIAEFYRNATNAARSPAHVLAATAMKGQPKTDALQQLRANLRAMEQSGNKAAAAAHREAIRLVQSGAQLSEGRTYQVEVPEDHQLLDYHAPLKDQSPAVRAALEKLGYAPTVVQLKGNSKGVSTQFKDMAEARRAMKADNLDGRPAEVPNPATGESIYRQLSKKLGGDEAASRALNEAGIPGLRYLDAGSRGQQTQGKTHNYVIFDDAHVDITGAFHQSRIKKATPAVTKLLKHLTPEEQAAITDSMAEKILAQLSRMPSPKEMAAVAYAGKAKRGWYARSADTISQVFGADAPRFAALLAALSPQCSVETNLYNTLSTWKNWTAAGRPTERNAIVQVMSRSVQGSGLTDSVLPSWINNSVRALTHEEPAKVTLSGPKVNSFFRNLIGHVDEVTNDAWMSNYALVEQTIFAGSKRFVDGEKIKVKGSGYFAMNARVREAAAQLSKLTGETWTPSEVQETVWSWAKTLYELANSADENRTARQIVEDGGLTDDLISSTPDFGSLFHNPTYASILKDAGYDNELKAIAQRNSERQPVEAARAGGEAAPFAADAQRRHELAAARRLERLADARGDARTAAAEQQADDALNEAGWPAEEGVYAQSAISAPTLNIGLAVNDGSAITADAAIAAIEAEGGQVVKHAVHQSNTEQTLVAQLAAPLTPAQADRVSVALKQDAIVQHDGKNGALYGPEAAKWGEFNPDFFLTLSGETLSATSAYEQSTPGQPLGLEQPLHGLLRTVKVDGHEVTFGPFVPARLAAVEYMKSAGLPYNPPTTYAKVDPERGARIARAFTRMIHDPNDPKVKASYAAMIDETLAQYRAILATGLKVEFNDTSADRWFSGSKVVDKDGSPLAVYHGTNADFSDFSGAYAGSQLGFHFGSQEQAGNIGDVSNIRPAYLSIKNPIRLEDTGAWQGRAVVEMVNRLAGTELNPSAGSRAIRAALEAKGYDGVVYENRFEGEGDSYIAFSPAQIKSKFEVSFGDPYGNPRNAILDVIHNNHLWVFSTRDGFGSDATFDAGKNPLLQETEFTDASGKPMLANDVFRVVHDYFGHVKEGVGFRADGEENAWRAHAAMYSDLARPAMTTETRGQNSWVNFGPHAAANAKADGAETVYADQKVGLLPDWVMTEGATDAAPTAGGGAPSAGTGNVVRTEGGRVDVQGVHYSTAQRASLNGRLYGRGLKGAERERLASAEDPRIKDRVYLYVDEGKGIRPESGVGGVAHKVEATNLYDINANPLKLPTADPNRMESAILDAGFDGYYVPKVFNGQGVAVILGNASHNVAVKSNAALGQGPRGTFNPSTLQISLLEGADLSTFLHETGHFFLEVVADIAGQSTVPVEVGNDMDSVLKWFGVKDLATWNALDLDGKRPYHEKFAEAFEHYLFEGKAPSQELQPLFARFRSWMTNVYKSITDFMASHDTKLSTEVRGVFDRLLASDASIQQAETAREYAPLFKSAEQAGMTPQEWAAYQAVGEQATARAVETLDKRSLRDMRWTTGARSRALRTLQKDAAAKRKAVEAEVKAELADTPVERARAYLKELAKGDAANSAEHKAAMSTWHVEYDNAKAAVKEAVRGDENFKGADERKLEVDRRMLQWEAEHDAPQPKFDPLALDGAAELFGYSSGDEMMRAINSMPKARDLIEDRVDKVLLERYGDLTTVQGMSRAADEAVHNEARARFIATGLKSLVDGSKQSEKVPGEKRSVNVIVKAARQFAETLTARRKVRDLSPAKHLAAETRAGKEALKAVAAGDTERAIAAQRDQLLNHFAARLSAAAQEEVGKRIKWLREFEKNTTLPPEYRDQIDQLLERFDLRETPLKQVDRRKSLASWVESQRAIGVEPELPEGLLDDASRRNYRDMSVEEFRGLVDAVRQIEHLGRLKGKLLTAKDQRDFETARDAIAQSIVDNAGKHQDADMRTPTTNSGRWWHSVKGFMAAHIKAATYARVMDGGKDGGAMWEHFVRGANEAGDTETTMRATAAKALSDIVAPYFAAGPMGGSGKFFSSVNRSFNREAVLTIALNTGNESNLQRLLGGENWTPEQLQPILDTLSASDWRVVQAIWDHFESYRPAIGAKSLRVYGVEPTWIDPAPRTVKAADGAEIELRGGYYPVKYDPNASVRAEEHADAEGAKRALQGAYGAATTRRSFTKTRVDEVVGRPLLYTLSGLYSGVNDVIHDLSWHEWLIDTNRLLKSQAIDGAMRSHYGPEVVRQFKSWRDAVAEGDNLAAGALDLALGKLRQGVSVAGLGFNVMSAAMQPLGYTQSVVRIGPKAAGRGLMQYLAHPVRATAEVHAQSEFMAGRARTRFRELNELRNKVQGQTAAREIISTGAYFLMMQAQQAVDVPTWLGAYEKAISDGGSDQARAVALADQAVIDSQGSGMTKDLSAIERGPNAARLFTVFYSFMNTAWNLGHMSRETPQSFTKKFVDAALIYVIPALLGAALRNALTPGDSGDDKDWKALMRKAIDEQVTFLAGMLVGVREFAEAIKAATGGQGHDYKGPAGVRVIADTSTLVKQAQQGAMDDQFRKAFVNLMGDVLSLPAAQVNRTVTGFEALKHGDTKNPLAVVFGYQKPKP